MTNTEVIAKAYTLIDLRDWHGQNVRATIFGLASRLERAESELATLRAENERLMAVVEAADKRQTALDEHLDAWGIKTVSTDKVKWLENRYNQRDIDLRLAIDALRAQRAAGETAE